MVSLAPPTENCQHCAQLKEQLKTTWSIITEQLWKGGLELRVNTLTSGTRGICFLLANEMLTDMRQAGPEICHVHHYHEMQTTALSTWVDLQ
jgi:hypothetical protein